MIFLFLRWDMLVPWRVFESMDLLFVGDICPECTMGCITIFHHHFREKIIGTFWKPPKDNVSGKLQVRCTLQRLFFGGTVFFHMFRPLKRKIRGRWFRDFWLRSLFLHYINRSVVIIDNFYLISQKVAAVINLVIRTKQTKKREKTSPPKV